MRLDVLNTHITLADAVPRVSPKRAPVTIQPALAIAPPVTIVTQIYLMVHVCITLRIMNSVITEIPCGTIVDLLLIRNQIVDFLDISLEIAEVLEGLIFCHDRLRILVEPVGARSDGSPAGQKEQRPTQKGFNVIIIFHNRIRL
jgi:hypothetical protein